MKSRNTMRVCSILLAASLMSAGSLPVRAQEKDHAVSSGQLRKDMQKLQKRGRQMKQWYERCLPPTRPGKHSNRPGLTTKK